MHVTRRNPGRELLFLASLLATTTGLSADKQTVTSPTIKPEGEDRNVIYRIDLLTQKLEPIAQKDLKAGYIYNYFNERLGRRAWSYLQADGSFWHAFGDGTTQAAWRFDVRATERELKKRLETMPELARQIETTGGRVLMELGADGNWKIAGAGLVSSCYSAETNQRWELQGTRYIPVVHSSGDRWQVRDSRYQPQ